MRPRPSSPAGKCLTAITLFLITGCVWWRSAPLVKEELSCARMVLGLPADLPEDISERRNEYRDANWIGGQEMYPIPDSIDPPVVAALPMRDSVR